jgi:transposase
MKARTTRAAGAHAIVVLDGAGWHQTGGRRVPGTLSLLRVPPYSPDLNPQDSAWHSLQQNRSIATRA